MNHVHIKFKSLESEIFPRYEETFSFPRAARRSSKPKSAKTKMANNDFELSLSPTIKKSAPSKGRRATTKQGFLDQSDDDLMVGSPLQSRPVSGDLFLDEEPKRPPPGRGRRTGGWADERSKTAKSVRLAGAPEIQGKQVPAAIFGARSKM